MSSESAIRPVDWASHPVASSTTNITALMASSHLSTLPSAASSASGAAPSTAAEATNVAPMPSFAKCRRNFFDGPGVEGAHLALAKIKSQRRNARHVLQRHGTRRSSEGQSIPGIEKRLAVVAPAADTGAALLCSESRSQLFSHEGIEQVYSRRATRRYVTVFLQR